MAGSDLVERITSAARAVGQTDPVVASHLTEVAGELRDPVVFTDADARTFGLRVDLPHDEWIARRVLTLQAGVTSSRALASAATARKGEIRVESALGPESGPVRGIGGGFVAVGISGPATLADDLEILGALGVEAEERDAVAARLRIVGDAGELAPRILRVVGFRGPADDNTVFELGVRAPDDLVARLTASARALQIARSQLAALDDLAGVPASVRAIVRPEVLVPGLVVVYGEQTLAAAQKLVTRLGLTYDAWLRFAELCQILGATTMRRVEITFGVERPTASLSVTA